MSALKLFGISVGVAAALSGVGYLIAYLVTREPVTHIPVQEIK
jgi:hypothetical protein